MGKIREKNQLLDFFISWRLKKKKNQFYLFGKSGPLIFLNRFCFKTVWNIEIHHCQPNSVNFYHFGETGDIKLILLDILLSNVGKIQLKFWCMQARYRSWIPNCWYFSNFQIWLSFAFLFSTSFSLIRLLCNLLKFSILEALIFYHLVNRFGFLYKYVLRV